MAESRASGSLGRLDLDSATVQLHERPDDGAAFFQQRHERRVVRPAQIAWLVDFDQAFPVNESHLLARHRRHLSRCSPICASHVPTKTRNFLRTIAPKIPRGSQVAHLNFKFVKIEGTEN